MCSLGEVSKKKWNFPNFWTGTGFFATRPIFEHFWKKNLENYHKILPVSKHSHSEVGLIHVISLGAIQKACRGEGW